MTQHKHKLAQIASKSATLKAPPPPLHASRVSQQKADVNSHWFSVLSKQQHVEGSLLAYEYGMLTTDNGSFNGMTTGCCFHNSCDLLILITFWLPSVWTCMKVALHHVIRISKRIINKDIEIGVICGGKRKSNSFSSVSAQCDHTAGTVNICRGML